MAERPNVGQATGTGGSSGIFSRKTELVADLTSAFKTLNQELEKTKRLSEDISKNLRGAKPGGSSDLLGSSFGQSTGTKTAQENDGSQNGGGGGINWGSIGASVLKTGLKLGGLAMQGMPTVQQAFEQDLLSSRFRFYGGSNANATQLSMARMGTTNDPMDAARASMMGSSMGLMPGLKNFNTITGSAAGISNLMPGVGLSGGMQATAALNQGRNVNMLRMIGVNVRDAQGMMRGFDDIAADLWKVLNRGKSGSGAISKEDLSMSLQPGNALDSMLNQYFGNDPILRQSVISKLMDMAGAGGPTSSVGQKAKSRLVKEGATTESVLSSSDRSAASLNAIQAVAPEVLKGFRDANKLLETASNKLADIARSGNAAVDALLRSKGFLDTMGSSGNGAGAGLMSMIGNGLGSFAGSLFGGKAGSLVGKGLSKASGAFGKFGKFMPKSLMGLLGRGAAAAGTYLGLDEAQDWLNEHYSGPEWLRDVGNFAFDTGQGAITGFVAGGIPGAIAGTAVGAVQGGVGIARNSNPGKTSGKGGSDTDSVQPKLGNVMPFSGSYPVTSEFNKVRYIITDPATNRHNASWGKPHGGVDYGTPEGTALYAVTSGTVENTPFDSNGFGNYIKINADDGAELFYGHLSQKGLSGGTRVKAGDLIGYSGNTGNSSGPHLHFEVRKSGTKLDPIAYLGGATEPSYNNGTQPPIASGLTLKRGAGDLILGGPSDIPGAEYGSIGGKHSDHAQTINYGGVTITFNMPKESAKDVKAIAQEVKRVLSEDSIREKAVTK